jgi:hypothetical protein
MHNRYTVYLKQLNRFVLNGALQTKAGLQSVIIVTAHRQTGNSCAPFSTNCNCKNSTGSSSKKVITLVSICMVFHSLTIKIFSDENNVQKPTRPGNNLQAR